MTSASSDRPAAPEPRRWVSWLVGLAILTTVIVMTVSLSEQRQFVALIQNAAPGWMAVALPLQALTYAAESQVWRAVIRADGGDLPLKVGFRLSLAKLFVDQSIPSGGIGGTVLFVQGLEREGVRPGAALAGLAVSTFSYYGAYLICLTAALAISHPRDYLNRGTVAVALLFMLISTVFSVMVLRWAGREGGAVARKAERFSLPRRALHLLREADPRLARSPRVLAAATGWQVAIFLLDAATLWCLLRAVGANATPEAVYASYMIASLFRSVGVLPGGLGTFDAASVLLLGAVGVPAAAALSATLLFRGLSSWLPMVPGVWVARSIARRHAG